MYPKIDKKFYLHGNNLGKFYYMFLIGEKVFEKLRNQFNPRAREKIIRQFKNKNGRCRAAIFFHNALKFAIRGCTGVVDKILSIKY